MSTIERAVAIAAEAHAGQTDKAGEVYLLHPLRVMLGVETAGVDAADARIAAVLHDVVEDTPWTLDGLRAEGFSEPVLAALDAVTRREGESYEAFVARAARDPLGRRVKLADLRDNRDPSRLPDPSPRDRERYARYDRAIAALDRRG